MTGDDGTQYEAEGCYHTSSVSPLAVSLIQKACRLLKLSILLIAFTYYMFKLQC